MATENYSVIGKPLPKVDGIAKATGQTKYADDINLPRQLYCKLLRSPHAHAKILSIDTSKAEKFPGVRVVLTGHVMPTEFGIMPSSQDEHALSFEKVRYVGDPVAAVAAVDEETAERACELIEVKYEILPAIMTIEDAINKSEPRIHEKHGSGGNLSKIVALEFGEVEKGLQEADLVQEDTFFFQGNTHLPMEQHAALASYEPDGKLTLWSSTQTPHYVHRALAKVLQIPESRIRVIAPPTGGGFGGKDDPFSHEIAIAKLSMMTGRPVKITLTRDEVFYAHRGRHPVLMWVKTGFKRDGRITAMHFKSHLDGGAHGSYGVASTYYTGALQTVTCKVPAYKFEGVRVFTNKPPCGPKRGHGTPQPRFALEVHFDKVAEKLGIDPVDLRLRNLVDPDSLTVNWLRITSCGLRECIEKVADASEFKKKRGKLGYGKGVGFGVGSYICGAGLPIYWNDMPHSEVHIKVDRTGRVTAFSGTIDIGQGSNTVLATIVAEILGLMPDEIQLVTADTDLTPIDLGSYSSRVTLMMGNAAVEAATNMKKILCEAASMKLEVPVDRIELRDHKVFDKANPAKSMAFEEAARLAESKFGALAAVGSYTPPKKPGTYKGSGVGPSPAYSYSACVAQVDCDPETGDVKVEKIWLAHDIGQCINEMLVIGQVEGSVYMALGEVLMEEMEYRNRMGIHKIPSLLDYKSPTTKEMPPVETILIKNAESRGPFGAKEVGQGPLLPVIPAVVNAVYDALGVRIDEIPITPDKVLKALDLKAQGKEPRVGPTSIPKAPFPPALKVEPPEEWKSQLMSTL
ncbi:molybdopterin-dependent oxidoreductase [Candidatus Acetothermia bacterium]|nr:molybdopterin-dependent oxidoreductase [Candidatus Acetothermia bacterium]